MRNGAHIVFGRRTGMKMVKEGDKDGMMFPVEPRSFPEYQGTHGKQCVYVCDYHIVRCRRAGQSKGERLRSRFTDHVRNFSIVKHSNYGRVSSVSCTAPGVSNVNAHVCRN